MLVSGYNIMIWYLHTLWNDYHKFNHLSPYKVYNITDHIPYIEDYISGAYLF